MHHGMAIPVKVEPLLSDMGGTQHKRPEGRVEYDTDGIRVLTCLLIRADYAVIRIAACEVLTQSHIAYSSQAYPQVILTVLLMNAP